MATNPDDALEQIANAPDTEEGLTEPVDIELTDDDMGGQSLADLLGEDTQPAPAEETPDDTLVGAEGGDAVTPEPPRKREPRSSERIRSLAAERDAALARAAELEADRDAARVAESEAVRAAVFNHHSALETRAEGLKARLLEAKRNGDNEAEVDLQAEFNRVVAERQEAKEWLETTRSPRAPAQPPEQRQAPAPAPAPQQQQLPAETAAWMSRNTWFQAGAPDFDPELAEEARLFARRLERRKPQEIGTPAYFMEIDRHMRTEFPDAFDDVAPAAPRGVPPMSRDATVAPVNRGGAPAPGAPSGRTVRLTAEQRSFAHQMAANGAFTNATGGRLTPAEAERHYAAQILKQGAQR